MRVKLCSEIELYRVTMMSRTEETAEGLLKGREIPPNEGKGLCALCDCAQALSFLVQLRDITCSSRQTVINMLFTGWKERVKPPSGTTALRMIPLSLVAGEGV